VTVVLELATKPGGRERFTEEGEIALAGVLEVDRGVSFQPYTEPELERLADRLDGEDEIVVDGAVCSGNPDLAFYLSEPPAERWEGQLLDVRLSMLTEHGRGLGVAAIAEATNGVRRLGPSGNVGELVAAGNTQRGAEVLRADAILAREVFQFGRDVGWVQARKAEGVGFERLEVEW